MLTIAIAIYAAVLITANLLVARFGPSVMPALAFGLIGLDLALRDWLQIRLKTWHMGALIAAVGVLTFALNPAAHRIALASAVSFALAALADWAVFSRMRGSWFRRSSGSNVAGAALDSLLFPTLAFGLFMPSVIGEQFVAKALGGLFWAAVISFASTRSARA